MHIVLDLDLDFFTSPVYTSPNWGSMDRAPLCEYTKCASASNVRHFLEQQCGLSKDVPIIGADFIHHDEAFYVWKRWIREGVLKVPFTVVHVDAHADMGIGNSGYIYLLAELLSLPVEERDNPVRDTNALNLGNFLMFAIANHWIAKLTYVYPIQSQWASNWCDGEAIEVSDWAIPGDAFAIHFRNGDPYSRIIELRHCTKETLDRCLGKAVLHPFIYKDDPVPFDTTAARNFKLSGFTHMVLSQSPQYTPQQSDELIPLIREYFTAS